MTAHALSPDADSDAPRAHPLTLFGFDALVAGAARPRPGAAIFHDAHDGAAEDLTYADLYSRVAAGAAQLRECGLSRGDRIVFCAPRSRGRRKACRSPPFSPRRNSAVSTSKRRCSTSPRRLRRSE
jgi:hypothetical protein